MKRRILAVLLVLTMVVSMFRECGEIIRSYRE